MSLIHVFAASSMEAEPIRKIAVPSEPGSPAVCGSNEVILITSGMGPINAKTKAEAALTVRADSAARRPDAVLMIGLCGGLTEPLPEGTIVAYTECRSTNIDNLSLPCSDRITDSIVALLASSDIRCDRVVGITSSHFATTRPERLALANHGAAVVDMESYSIVNAATNAGVPAAVLRVVSDSIDRELPDLNRALNNVGALDGRKALKVALASPLSTARLLAANRRAMKRLTPALQLVLKAPCFASSSSSELPR
jgi:nucleoside phosphorylase